jgi:signal transduction histidine kinase
MLEIVDNDDVRRARHDLRTVVNHLQGYATLLQEDDVAWNREPEMVHALELIHESSHEVLRIIELAAPGKRNVAPAQLLSQLSADLEAPAQAVH